MDLAGDVVLDITVTGIIMSLKTGQNLFDISLFRGIADRMDGKWIGSGGNPPLTKVKASGAAQQ